MVKHKRTKAMAIALLLILSGCAGYYNAEPTTGTHRPDAPPKPPPRCFMINHVDSEIDGDTEAVGIYCRKGSGAG